MSPSTPARVGGMVFPWRRGSRTPTPSGRSGRWALPTRPGSTRPRLWAAPFTCSRSSRGLVSLTRRRLRRCRVNGPGPARRRKQRAWRSQVSRMLSKGRALASALIVVSAVALPAAAADEPKVLRVCADPDNLPFSNSRSEGFENKIAQLVANELHASLRYAWSPMSAASISQMLDAGKCDLIVGAPAAWDPVLTTKPYYASTYVF